MNEYQFFKKKDESVLPPQPTLEGLENIARQKGISIVKSGAMSAVFAAYQAKEKSSSEKFIALRKAQKFDPPNGTKMPAVGYNVLGFPVYSNLVIKGGNYKDDNGNVIAQFNDIRIDCVIMELECENQLITTDIQGRSGTIIEYVGAKSYNIHCYGRFLADIAGVYPEADVAEFVRAMNANRPLQVSSWFLGMAGIYAMQVKKHSIHQEEGSQEYQKFEFDAIADSPVLLKLQN